MNIDMVNLNIFTIKSAEELLVKLKEEKIENLYQNPEERFWVYFRVNKFTEEKFKF